MVLTKEELAEDLCRYCPCTEFGFQRINTGPWNMCEGGYCDDAYANYLEERDDDDEIEE